MARIQRRCFDRCRNNCSPLPWTLLLGVWAIFDLGLGMLALSYLFAFQALFAGFTLLALAYHLRERKVEETADSTANFDAKAPQEAPHA